MLCIFCIKMKPFSITLFRFLSSLVDPGSTPGTSFPDTSLSSPVLLFSKDNNGVALAGIDPDAPAFPALPNPVSVENDATLAK